MTPDVHFSSPHFFILHLLYTAYFTFYCNSFNRSYIINCRTQIQHPAGAMDLTPYINLLSIILVASHLCICVRVLELCICICVFVFVQMYLSCSEHPKRHQRKLPRALEKLLVLRKLFLHPAEMLNIALTTGRHAEHWSCNQRTQKCKHCKLLPADVQCSHDLISPTYYIGSLWINV